MVIHKYTYIHKNMKSFPYLTLFLQNLVLV